MVQNIFKRRPFLSFFVLSLVIILCAFWPFLSLEKLMLYKFPGDTIHYNWPFLYHFIEDILKRGFSLWSFKVGLGVSSFSFVTALGMWDPFNVFFVLAGTENIAYLYAYVFSFKIVVAGGFFYLYLHSLGIKKYPTLVASLLYAFSGVMLGLGQWVPNWATIIVLLPLVLYAFERYLQNKNYLLFPLAIGLFNISTGSFFFLFQLTIFLTFYALYRYFQENKFSRKTFLPFFLRISGLYLLGVGLTAFLTIPFLAFVLRSSRIAGVDSQAAKLLQAPIFALNDLPIYISTTARLFANDILGNLSLIHI